MIRRGSTEWETMIERLARSKAKLRREKLCLQCWEIIPLKDHKVHLDFFPDHKESVLYPKEFCRESKFIEICYLMGKTKKEGDEEYYESPFKVQSDL